MQHCALITGGASGIGRSIAHVLAQDGCAVIIADQDKAGGEAVAREMGATFLEADLGDSSSCSQLIKKAAEHVADPDIIINNAGFQHVEDIEHFPVDIWQNMISVMLTAPFLLTKYAWPFMKKQQWGRIINIASIHGMVASPSKAGYITAKHGLIGLTRAASLEGGPHKITANALCPAYVRTPLVEKQIAAQAQTHNIPEEDVVQKIMLEPAPLKHLIEPEEVADLVSFLCSDKGRSVTGSCWTIDCGWTAR